MTITIPEPPSDSVKELFKGIAEVSGVYWKEKLNLETIPFVKKVKFITNLLDSENVFSIEIISSHPIYTIPLIDITNEGLKVAQKVSWRYYFIQQGESLGCAEVSCDESRGHHKFYFFETGNVAEDTLKLIEQIQQYEQVQSSSYNLQLLRIPELYVFVIWLKSKASSIDDIFVAIPPGLSPLQNQKLYLRNDFENILCQMAQEKIQMNQKIDVMSELFKDIPGSEK